MQKKIETKIIGAFLKQKRKEQQSTLQAIADTVGISVGYLSAVENGINIPKADVLKKLLIALNVEVKNFKEEIELRAIKESNEIGVNFAIASNLEDYIEKVTESSEEIIKNSVLKAIELRALENNVLLKDKELFDIANLINSVLTIRIEQIKGDK
ncbi:MAG: helix-turn-helix transcriptional regulator [Paeniclostridium sp.]|nr:helix-turn-helix transcriptional regulator [Paeniclostridium sp.]MBW4862638.1 helix-turn-helix transcriptional regulator [Paeniclostridium sp.]MBW4875098.1 helix-turn-helix transcriptional regulator [Paeniclostridium sp.]